MQGPRSTFWSGGGGGGLNWTKSLFFGGGDAWEFLFDCSIVTENAFITITITIFPHHQ